MKISMSVMIILTTLFCVIPFISFMIIGKNNSKKREKLFKDAIKGESLTPNIKEQWNHNFIGLDKSQNIIIFLKLINQEVTIFKIDLKQLISCQINRKTREFKTDKKMETELQSLDLELTTISNGEPIILNFYNIEEGFSEDLELKRAEKWQSLIQEVKQKAITYKKTA